MWVENIKEWIRLSVEDMYSTQDGPNGKRLKHPFTIKCTPRPSWSRVDEDDVY